VRDGDIIAVDAEAGTIHVELSEEQLRKREEAFKPIAPRYTYGVLAKYAKLVGPACNGAVTY
jgi:dihydroxy-acid dehydratase